MRWLNGLLLTALGWGLALALQWAWSGESGLPAAAPPWTRASLPLTLFLLFGLYLALVTGGRPARSLMLLQAVVALAVAALPFAYASGLAARYGLPAAGGPVGSALAQPLARGVAAVWLAMAVASALRRRSRRAPPAGSATRVPHADAPLPAYWSPAPVVEPAAPAFPTTLAPPAATPDVDGA